MNIYIFCMYVYVHIVEVLHHTHCTFASWETFEVFNLLSTNPVRNTSIYIYIYTHFYTGCGFLFAKSLSAWDPCIILLAKPRLQVAVFRDGKHLIQNELWKSSHLSMQLKRFGKQRNDTSSHLPLSGLRHQKNNCSVYLLLKANSRQHVFEPNNLLQAWSHQKRISTRFNKSLHNLHVDAAILDPEYKSRNWEAMTRTKPINSNLKAQHEMRSIITRNPRGLRNGSFQPFGRMEKSPWA